MVDFPKHFFHCSNHVCSFTSKEISVLAKQQCKLWWRCAGFTWTYWSRILSFSLKDTLRNFSRFNLSTVTSPKIYSSQKINASFVYTFHKNVFPVDFKDGGAASINWIQLWTGVCQANLKKLLARLNAIQNMFEILSNISWRYLLKLGTSNLALSSCLKHLKSFLFVLPVYHKKKIQILGW